MGVLFPRNLKKKPMNSRHILRASSNGTAVSKDCRPEAETKIIAAGVSFEKALMRSIPKKPSSVANFSWKDAGEEGF